MGGHTFVGDELERETAQSFIDLIYETRDGYISVAVQSDKEWAALCRAFDKPEWREDPRFADGGPAPREYQRPPVADPGDAAQRHHRRVLERLEAEDVPCAPVLRRRDVIRHPQLAANETLVESEHPVAGTLRQARPAPRFSKTPTALRHPAPRLGEHSREILGELGLSTSEIEALASEA